MSSTSTGRSSDWFGWVLVALLTYVATYYAERLGMSHTGVVALWPAAGITLWGCWRYGWPAAVAGFCAFYAYGLIYIHDFSNFLPSLGNALAAWLGAWAIRHKSDQNKDNQFSQMVQVILVGGLILSVLSALIGGTHLAWVLGLNAHDSFILALRWCLSDIAGVVITAPFLFAWSKTEVSRLSDYLGVETVVAGVLCVFLTWLIRTPIPDLNASAIILLTCAPVVAWVVLRPSRIKALGALSLIGLASLTLGARTLNADNSELLQTQLFTLMFLITAFLLHELLKELRTNNRILLNHKEELEAAVLQRTQELLEAKQRAESADQAKTQFLANTSHEVRTPLNAILGMAEFLSESDLKPDQAAQVGTIISSGRSLMYLLNDVIDLSKVEAGKMEITSEPTDLTKLVEDLSVLWLPKAQAKGLVFKIESHQLTHAHYMLDGDRLRQCLSNLISNAIKFTESGSVTVRISQPSDKLVFVVSDTGPGIDANGICKLFEPFEQLDRSVSRNYGGTGLGLAIVKRLIELMDGEVGVTSEPNCGAAFTLTLPALATSPVQPSHQTIEHKTPSISGKRILLVEDNAVNRLVARGHLRTLDVTVEEAQNGKECLAQLKKQKYDLVLLDIHMPVMDGIETIKHIRQAHATWRDIPVIALTADAMRDDRARLMDIGMSGYASKPINRQALVREMELVLQN